MKTEISDKIVVQQLISYCKHHGINRVVISPGSRNAPLTLSFSNDIFFEVFVIADERAAAFFALGLTLFDGRPTMICCTSGSAPLNYAPALAEAFYQKLPLLAITADRPLNSIHQKDGQSINQHNIFDNFCSYFAYFEDIEGNQSLHKRKFAEGFNCLLNAPRGPVHFNFHFSEPLYNTANYNKQALLEMPDVNVPLSVDKELQDVFKGAEKVLLLIGQRHIFEPISEAVLKFAKQHPKVVIITESTANLPYDLKAIHCIDRFIEPMSEKERQNFIPDLLISTSGAVISKKIRALFQRYSMPAHWHIGYEHFATDFSGSVSHHWQIDEIDFFTQFSSFSSSFEEYSYKSELFEIENRRKKKHRDYLSDLPFCDFKVFETIFHFVPENSFVHLANSTPVRYWQLFDPIKQVFSLSNRGVSGIDGSTSTAHAFAFLNDEFNVLITGDQSFFYDSNGMWHEYKKGNLLVILINNGGGDIFSIITGPNKVKNKAIVFNAKHQLNAQGIALTFGYDYSFASNEQELHKALENLFDLKKEKKYPQLLEIFTANAENAKYLLKYFDALREHK